MSEPLLTLSQVCERLHCSENGVRNLIKRKRLQVVKFDGRLRFEPAAIAALIESGKAA